MASCSSELRGAGESCWRAEPADIGNSPMGNGLTALSYFIQTASAAPRILPKDVADPIRNCLCNAHRGRQVEVAGNVLSATPAVGVGRTLVDRTSTRA